MRVLSKSKLLASLQCSKRLWLEIHHPELNEDSKQTKAAFSVGNSIGSIARKIYDPHGQGTILDVTKGGIGAALTRTTELLSKSYPIFEAGFTANGALAFADALIPDPERGEQNWRMVEVKSSTSVKDYHRDDIAVQSYMARNTGLNVNGPLLSYVD